METTEEKQEGRSDGEPEKAVPSYGLLVINHAYSEGKITFKEWLELSREWAERMIKQYRRVHKTLPRAII